MPLRVGATIPDFRAPDAEGRAWTRADLAGRPFVLFFYPADETPGCVTEACAYRDAWEAFRDLGVPVLGVSRDPPERHRAFAQRRQLPFTLLSDPDGRMRDAFGAWMLGRLPRRVSYLVDAEGRVAAVFDSALRPGAHAREMLAATERLTAGRRAP
ncbi:MAG TPA: peroxiredoxin [Candidatus Thermoplasmatota archaeon]|nr:peroxiredoxin [Candidatus Thermoplasmatota archaeon]